MLIVTVCMWMIPSSAASVDDATIKSYEDQLAANREKQKELEAQLAGLSGNLSDALSLKATYDSSIEVAAQQKIILENMISDLEGQITALEEEEAATLESIESQRQTFLERVAASQQSGTSSYLELLLSSENMTTFLAQYEYVSAVLEYDKQIISELKESKIKLETTRAELEAAVATHEASMATLEEEQEYYETLVAEQDAIINSINNDANLTQSMIDTLKQDDAALDASIQEALAERKRQEELWKQQQEEANKQQNSSQQPQVQPQQPEFPYTYADGEFAWPLTTGYISSSFGGRTLSNGDTSYHYATDIACSTGTPIYSSNSGTVLRSEWHNSYGNYVLIDHGNDITTLYAHMSVRTCVPGQVVSRGDKIGEVGNTGYSFGSHLHFEYRISGQRVDPEIYVNRY